MLSGRFEKPIRDKYVYNNTANQKRALMKSEKYPHAFTFKANAQKCACKFVSILSVQLLQLSFEPGFSKHLGISEQVRNKCSCEGNVVNQRRFKLHNYKVKDC
jgi:hypothetical protein